MFTSKRTCLSAAVSGILAAAVAMPAMAQTTEMEEIIVTARKRDESFLEVPVTMTVFTGAQIRSAGIQMPRDFIQLVPNMTLVETQNAGNAFVVVRGISQARNSEPSVAVTRQSVRRLVVRVVVTFVNWGAKPTQNQAVSLMIGPPTSNPTSLS